MNQEVISEDGIIGNQEVMSRGKDIQELGSDVRRQDNWELGFEKETGKRVQKFSVRAVGLQD